MIACLAQAYFTVNWTQYKGAAGILFMLSYIEPLAWIGSQGKIPAVFGGEPDE